MKQKIRYISIGCVLILLAVMGLAGFYVGKTIEAEHFQEEKKFNILLNRSELEGFGKIDGTIYVAGHKSPDSDAVGSSIAYAYLLRALGYDAIPVVLGKINHETAFILEVAGLKTPELLKDASGLNMILVDHSEYTQSANGLKNAKIISIIDHHGDGSVTTANPLIYDSRPIGSAATVIWLRYRNYGIEPDRQTAIAMLGAILSDTKNLKSGTTTYADREAVKALSTLGGISDTDAFYQGMYKALISYEDMSDEEIFFSDYKEYKIGDKNISVGCINAHNEENAKELIDRMKKTMTLKLSSTKTDLSFALISILHDDISVTYIVPSNDIANEVLKTAFGDTAVFDGTSHKIEPYASRKTVFIPAITNVLKSYSKK
jgi:manganese-dependent inorganic pyrophosphatase